MARLIWLTHSGGVYSFICYTAALADSGGIFIHGLTPVPIFQETTGAPQSSSPLLLLPKRKKRKIIKEKSKGTRRPVQLPAQNVEPQV